MSQLQDMTRDEHYAAIEQSLASAAKAQTLNPGKAAVFAAEATVHANLLVEKALRDARATD